MSEPRTAEYTDEEIRKLPACPKCGLEARSLLHPFCQNEDCPVLRALGKTKMPGMLEEIVNPTKVLSQADSTVENLEKIRVAFQALRDGKEHASSKLYRVLAECFPAGKSADPKHG